MAKEYSLRIKRLRKALGLTQHALARKLGVLPWAVSSWEQGRWEPSGEHYAQLARLAPPNEARYFLGKLGLDRETLGKFAEEKDLRSPSLTAKGGIHSVPLRSAEEKGFRSASPAAKGGTKGAPVIRGEEKTHGTKSVPWLQVQAPEIRIYTTEQWKPGTQDRLRFQVQVPVLRDEAAAGSPREINERDIESFIAVPSKFAPKGMGAYSGIYIRGDSMEPVLRDHFIVVVDHTERDPSRLRGRMVAALAQGGVLVKWLARETRGDRLVLRSENPAYEDIVLESPETNPIIGDVVFWWGIQ